MPIYKCPVCGRGHIEIPHYEATDGEAGTMTLPQLHTEARCKDCGWFGTVEELKVSY